MVATGRLLSGGYGRGALDWFKRLLGLQIWFAGVQAMILAVGAGLALAGVALGVGWNTLAEFGGQEYFGELMRLAVLGEMGPLVAALIVIGRSGTAIASELGRMKLHAEIDALRVHGVEPSAFLGAPRLIGMCLANAALTVILCSSAYLGVILFFDHPETFSRAAFARLVLDAILPGDVLLCVGKGLLFGLIIPPIAIAQALNMRLDPNEIPRTATRAVVWSMVAVFALDAAIAVF